MKFFCIALAILAQSALFAANVPVEWTADVESLHVQNLSARRGETLDIAAKLTYRGRPFTPEGDWEIFYQTNGMEDVFFTFPVAVSGNVARLTFTPSMDPGAERITGFIGRRGVNYRAAFALRFYGSPGATPNALTLPTKTIDFAQIEVHNAPWATAADLADKRDKTDLMVWGRRCVTPYQLVDDACPVLVREIDGSTSPHKGIVFYESDVSQDDAPSYDPDYIYLYAKTYDPEIDWWMVDFRVAFRRSDGVADEIDYDGGFEDDDITFGGKPFKAGAWPRLKTTAQPTADQLATTSTVANVARSVVNTVWDPKLGVAWEARMHNGALYYIAVTNRPPEVAQ